MTELTIECPSCGRERDLLPSEAHEGRLVARCDCGGAMRAVYETSASEPPEYEEEIPEADVIVEDEAAEDDEDEGE